MTKIDLTFAPRLMGATDAAAYIGVSTSTLRGLPIPRKVMGGRRLFDRLDLDAYAAALPYEGGTEDEAASCDKAFGL
ncbi:MAG: DNA-binding protein [Paracoccus sp. (in: a-proteobacteria)]|uniref:helix-turn-helix transcriptional regulator n=1 Tax=Paracoccus sp. TaxID=267 RepID=UPI0026E02771|nr:DNA-binding protein [Paracoccus sp. (in: a-proteobacteria)]MDO5621824.1 DNA-binding protein [Paracoccus sp. (in: a-proteobacteria)]